MADLIAQETGEVITRGMIEALAAEAEEGYDLSVAIPMRVGRPALAGGTSTSPRITIRTAPQLYKAIQARAAADGRSVSDVVRDALRRTFRGNKEIFLMRQLLGPLLAVSGLLALLYYGQPPSTMPGRIVAHAAWRAGHLAPRAGSDAGRMGAPGDNRPARGITVGRYPTAVAVDDATGRVFVTSAFSVTVLDARSGAVVRSINMGTTGPFAVTIAARARRAFVLTSSLDGAGDPGGPHYHNPDGAVTILDTRSGAVVGGAEVGISPAAVAVDEQTSRVFVVNAFSESESYGPIGDPSSPGSVSVLDMRTGRVRRTVFAGFLPGGIAADERTGRVFVTNSGSGSISVLDARSGAVTRTVHVGSSPRAIAVDAAAGHVFVTIVESSGAGLSVRVLDARNGSIVRTVAAGHGAGALAVDTRRHRVFVATDDGVTTLDGVSGAVLRRVATGVEPGAIAVDETVGRAIVIDALGASARVLDATGAVLSRVSVGSDSTALAVGERNGCVFIANSGGDTVSVFNDRSAGHPTIPTAAPSPLLRAIARRDPAVVALDARRNHVFVVGASPFNASGDSIGHGAVSMLDAASGNVLRVVAIAPGSEYRVAVDATAGRLLIVSNTQRGALTILDTQSGAVVRTIDLGRSDDNGWALMTDDPDGHAFVVSGVPTSARGIVDIFDVVSGRQLRAIVVGPSPHAVMDERTKRLFVLSHGVGIHPGSVRVFDTRDGTLLRTISLASMSPDDLVLDQSAKRVFVVDGPVLRLLDAGNGTVLRTIRGLTISALALDETANRVFAYKSGYLGYPAVATLNTLDASTGALLRTVRVTSSDTGVVPFVDAPVARVYVIGAGVVLDARTGTVVRRVSVPGDPRGVDTSNGRLFLSSFASPNGVSSVPDRLIVLDGRTGRPLHTVTTGGSPDAPVIDERTGRAFIIAGNNTVLMLDAARL